MKFYILIAALLTSITCQAADKYVVTVTADMIPNKEGHLGVSLNEKNEIEAILFSAPGQRAKRFPLAKIAELTPVFTVFFFNSNWTIIRLQAQENADHSVSVSMEYLHNRFSLHPWHGKDLIIRYNPHTALPECYEKGNERPLSLFHVETNTFSGSPVGIADIEMR